MTKYGGTLLLLCAFAPAYVSAESTTWEQCVQENAKDAAGNETAMMLIRGQCAQLHPDTAPEEFKKQLGDE